MRRMLLSFVLLLPILAHAQEMPDRAASKPNLTVLVDDSLLLPMSQLARRYTLETGTPLTITAKDGPMAANQIGQGLEAHLLITANQALVNGLAAQGLTDVSSRHTIASAPLVLVAPTALNPKGLLARHISFAAILLATPQLPIYLNTPESPDGQLAASLLHGYEFSATLAARAVVLTGRAEILAAMAEKPGLALMLASDAAAAPELAVLSVLPNSLSAPLTFDSVVLASESMEDARTFNQFLGSATAEAGFSRFGLQSAPTPAVAAPSTASGRAVLHPTHR